MKHIKLSRVFTAGLLFLSFSGFTNVTHAKSKKLDKASIYTLLPTDSNANMSMIEDLSEKDTTVEEFKLLESWADKVDKGTLKSDINNLVMAAEKNESSDIAKQLKTLHPEKREYAINTAVISIESIVKLRGLTKDSKQNAKNYREWSVLSDAMIQRLDKSKTEDLENVLEFSNSSWMKTEKAELLVDGTTSFAKRKQIMNSAQNFINILTWSVYDDVTGTELADLLIQKKKAKAELKVRVIIDGLVANQRGHNEQLKRMEENGIEVIYWKNLDHSFVGQHRKMIIVDNEHLIAGGLNYGDVYSHANITVPGWRDTDIYLKGVAAVEGNALFAQLWNQQIDLSEKFANQQSPKIKYSKVEVPNTKDSKSKTTGESSGIKVSIINHDPVNYKLNSINHKNNVGSTIIMTILKAIRSAKKTVDIENAYIILFPGLKKEIQDAVDRGVKVRVLTNSLQSVDEPAVSIPIVRSAKKLAEAKAEVYLRKGTTLHSKLMVVDSEFSMIMSYNLHPRSERFEGEMAIAILDKTFAENLVKVFEDDIAADKADKILDPAKVEIPNSSVSPLVLRLFFDDL